MQHQESPRHTRKQLWKLAAQEKMVCMGQSLRRKAVIEVRIPIGGTCGRTRPPPRVGRGRVGGGWGRRWIPSPAPLGGGWAQMREAALPPGGRIGRPSACQSASQPGFTIGKQSLPC